jgi:hypothetical protein
MFQQTRYAHNTALRGTLQQKLVAIAIAALCTLPPFLAMGQEPNGDLQQCRSLQQKIERLDAQRKKGGSASQMDRWKRQRQGIKDEFNALRCRNWGNQLR